MTAQKSYSGIWAMKNVAWLTDDWGLPSRFSNVMAFKLSFGALSAGQAGVVTYIFIPWAKNEATGRWFNRLFVGAGPILAPVLS